MIDKIKLPHGNVPVSDIQDPSTRMALMKVNENIARLLESVQVLKAAIDAKS